MTSTPWLIKQVKAVKSGKRDTVLLRYMLFFHKRGRSRGGGVLEHWSATENVTGVLERSENKGWSARVLEVRKTSWSLESEEK